MKRYQFLIFLSVVFTIHFLINYYILSRIEMGIDGTNLNHPLLQIIFWSLVSSYGLGRFLERTPAWCVGTVFTWIGAFWFAFMMYGFLYVLLIDIVRIIVVLISLITANAISWPDQMPFILFAGGLILVFLLIISGHINAVSPVIRKQKILLNKGLNKDLRIAMVSDIHLGTIIKNRRLGRLVKKINATNPDLILLAGDIVDEDIAPVIRHNMGKQLEKLHAPLGIFGITGNHEYIGGAEQAVDYLSKHGVRILRDEALLINNSFYLIGREDHDSRRFDGSTRKSLKNLMVSIDQNKPTILLDHQPYAIEEKADLGFDLSLSGHTHHGQLWPLNFITRAVFKISHGYKKINNSHFYVSCGVGSWGPPVRLGSRPEIVVLEVEIAH
ncbi:MAG: metallophosphoesterase [Bacteroidales bacterium]|nr:metallophosphoesterase [Bacteroidales bacterium]